MDLVVGILTAVHGGWDSEPHADVQGQVDEGYDWGGLVEQLERDGQDCNPCRDDREDGEHLGGDS